jgi:hypothetical protein
VTERQLIGRCSGVLCVAEKLTAIPLVSKLQAFEHRGEISNKRIALQTIDYFPVHEGDE